MFKEGCQKSVKKVSKHQKLLGKVHATELQDLPLNTSEIAKAVNSNESSYLSVSCVQKYLSFDKFLEVLGAFSKKKTKWIILYTIHHHSCNLGLSLYGDNNYLDSSGILVLYLDRRQWLFHLQETG